MSLTSPADWKARLRLRRRKAGLRPPRPPWQRFLWQATLFLLLVGFGAYLLDSPALGFVERQAFGLQMKVYAQRHGSLADHTRQQIVLLPINEKTFLDPQLSGLGQPLPRWCHAKVVRELEKAGAKTVVFDLLFDYPRPGQDETLAAAVRDFKKVVWAALWQEPVHDGDEPALIGPNATLRNASGYIGHARTPQNEIDPAADRIEALIKTPQGDCPALAVQAARVASDLEKFPLQSEAGWLRVGRLAIPLGSDGTFKIAYAGEPGRSFQAQPYAEVFKGIDKNEMWRANETFKDKIVLIGDTTLSGKDYTFTPLGRMSGIEIHAHALATLLQGAFIHEAGFAGDMLAVLLMTALAWLLAARLSLRHALKGALCLLLGYFLFNNYLFVERGLDVALMVPLITIALMMAGVVAERGSTEEGARQRMTDVLDQYVSPQVAHTGPPQGEVTLVFTDIEGSSQLSQQHGAAFEHVRDEHFLLLREKARRWNGFEVETAGDSLFVVFQNAPDAVRFAIESQLVLARHKWPAAMRNEINGGNWFTGNNSALQVRIGMHTGTPYIGRDRAHITYRGPATNLANRVMGAAHGGQILVSQVTWDRAREELAQDENFANIKATNQGTYLLKGVGEDTLWQICHPDLLEPPPPPPRDSLAEDVP